LAIPNIGTSSAPQARHSVAVKIVMPQSGDPPLTLSRLEMI